MERFVPGISCWLLFRKQRIPAVMWTMQISPRPAWSMIPSPSRSWLRYDSALERLLGSVARGLCRNISASLLLLPPSPGSKLQESNSSCCGNKHPTTARWGILQANGFARGKHKLGCGIWWNSGHGQCRGGKWMRWDRQPSMVSVVSSRSLNPRKPAESQ